jgi:glucose-6-phosphate isomerase
MSKALVPRAGCKALQDHCDEVSRKHLRELFAEDEGRGTRLAPEAARLYLDDSKNRVTDKTVRLPVELAHDSSTNALIRRYRERRLR